MSAIQWFELFCVGKDKLQKYTTDCVVEIGQVGEGATTRHTLPPQCEVANLQWQWHIYKFYRATLC